MKKSTKFWIFLVLMLVILGQIFIKNSNLLISLFLIYTGISFVDIIRVYADIIISHKNTKLFQGNFFIIIECVINKINNFINNER